MTAATDRQFAETMVKMHTDNLLYLQSQPDSSYADIEYALNRINYYSRQLFADFQMISGCAR